MQLLQSLLSSPGHWRDLSGELDPREAGLVLVFGLRKPLAEPAALLSLRARFPVARLVLTSTAGNFADIQLEDGELVCTALKFSTATVRTAAAQLTPAIDLRNLCRGLADELAGEGLRHVLLFSDGSLVNGTVLSEALNTCLPAGVTLSGGLAGDGTDFAQTAVGLDAAPGPGWIVAVGLYGASLRLSFGSAGGWSSFGPARLVTAAKDNVLRQLDNRPALEIYKTYLGPEAAALPAAALRFPLCLQLPGEDNAIVRTILSIDEGAGTMTFAGNLPVGATVRLMRASQEDLITGAEDAASRAAYPASASLVLCVSCVGRRIVLGHRTEEELEGVRAAIGPGPVLTGFYSYGELAPSGQGGSCQLHNQTMTVTHITELDA
jgi:hypothetical protein